MTSVLNNYETAGAIVQLGIKKGKTPFFNTLLQGFMGAMFVALGYMGYHVINSTLAGFDAGLARLLGASVFPVGLMLVVFVGGDLFTGNALASVALLDRKISFAQLIKNWTAVWIGNLLGAIFTAVLVSYTALYSGAIRELTISMAEHKVHMGPVEVLSSAFFCNILVALSIWMVNAMKDGTAKLLAIWFPIMLFALIGFQHVVANMFIFSIAYLIGAHYTLIDLTQPLALATVGNALSGGVFLPVIYYFLYVKDAH